MSNLNPMFHRNYKSRPKLEKTKKRIDKKMDIKVAVTLDEKSRIRKLNFDLNRNLSITQFSSNLVIEGLDIPYILYSPYRKPPRNYEYVHVKLPLEYQSKLLDLSIKWECSLRKAARRILINLLEDKREVI
ncbi:hypothetical protein AB3Z07_28465 (plasmid) [Metabacillus halosaccharovorans]|uniref:hypothetical protein n=1 Tax=Metabacillus halosaccharovorans TaxID=930124 RepID=UPI000C80B62A|nr:hypothetical protein [Metabacillus halosaccharovorans]MBU7595836.1 hypothetical protein [Metabacillus halosaccharovorans]MCM3441455.1 hypothetical protein [Metabacillus halosaccharovorans]PMC36307.1 hypothetical protein CJ195_16005 [Bacillus sp. UMB0899]